MAKKEKTNSRIEAVIQALKCAPNCRIYACEDKLNPSVVSFVLESKNGPSVDLGRISKIALEN